MKLQSLLLVSSIASVLSACDNKGAESNGYQDGYAATVNTTCNFRATMIDGNFDNGAYSKGYSKGAQAGALAVAQQGCDRLK
jgi:hypothetical protein